MAAAEIFIDGSITHFLLVWDFHTLSSVGTSSFVQLVLIRLFAVLLLSTSIFYFGGNSGKGSSRIVIIFKRVHRVRWEGGKPYLRGGGQWPPYAFKNVDYDALHFYTGSVKSTFSKYYFGREGGVTKRVLCVRF